MSRCYGQIYKITYPGDPYYYYGQTKLTLEKRLRLHKTAKDYTDVHQWVRSLENLNLLKIELIDEANDQRELDSKENKVIGDLWISDVHCLNMCPGGLGISIGENHPASKYPDVMVNYIRENNHLSPTYLASIFHVSTSYVCRVIYNEVRRNPDYIPPERKNTYDRTGMLAGEKNGKAIFNWYWIFYVRVHCPTFLDRELSLMIPFEPHRRTISNIIRNLSWKDPNWDSVDRVYTGEPKGWEDWWEDELGHWSTS